MEAVKNHTRDASQKVVIRQFAQASNRILAGDDPALNTTNTEYDSVINREAEEIFFHRIVKVQDFLDMWQGCQNLHGTQKESCAQNEQMTAVGYISDTKEIVKAPGSLFKHAGPAAFELSERSPLLPPWIVKDDGGGPTRVLNVHRTPRIDHYLVERDEDCGADTFSDTANRPHWSRDLDIPNDSEDNCKADVDSDFDLDNAIKNAESPELWDVSATLNVPGLNQPTPKSSRQAEE